MRVIVVGGGVAGATSAIALRRLGAEVTVYEAYADPAGQVGSFLSLASNGLRGLDALGCLGRVQRAGFAVPRQRMWSDSGRLMGETARGRLSTDPLHSVTMLRGRLVDTLREEAVRVGARIVVGARLVDAITSADGVEAEFEGGRTATADLLIGADGIRSSVRRALDPVAPAPTYAGLYSVSGISEGVETEPGIFNMVFGRGGAFVYLAAPGGSLWWSAQVADPRPPEFAGDEDGALLGRLGDIFRFEEMPRRVLGATTELHRPTLMHTLADVPTWHDDRIALVGDALHPVGAGQGASMAIEDAVALTRAVAEEGSIPAALAGYERMRRPRITKMRKAGDDNRDAKAAGPISRRMRGVIMPIVLRHFYEKATGWLYTYDPGTLPEAPAPVR